MIHGLGSHISRWQMPLEKKIIQPLVSVFKRSVFKAIEDNYDMGRLKERLKDPKALTEVKMNKTTVLHSLAGADPHSGLATPIRKAPPKEFVECVLQNYPDGQLSRRNVYDKTPLSIAASTGNTEVVRQLLAKEAIDKEDSQPIVEALFSTVHFDPSFTIPNMLVERGLDVNVQGRTECSKFFTDAGLLSMLVDTVDRYLRIGKNSLHSDFSRIEKFHFNFLPEKAEWLCRQSLKDEKDYFKAIDISLSLMDPFPNSRLQNRVVRPVVPILVKYCNPALYEPYDDSRAGPLLHSLVFYQCEEAVEELLQKGAAIDEEDKNGLMPHDLAALNMNAGLLQMLGKDSVYLSSLDPHYFGKTIMKLPSTPNRRPLKSFDAHFKTGLPGICTSAQQDAHKKLLAIYLPSDSISWATPMAAALESKDDAKVKQLLAEGWNIFIEEEFVKYQRQYELKEVKGTEDVLYGVLERWKKGYERLIQAPYSGVTLTNELHRILDDIGERCNQKKVFDLFKLGLNPDTYEGPKGSSLLGALSRAFSSSYSDEGGKNFRAYPGYNEMYAVMREVEKRGWKNR